jgi:hypothetical protein
VRSVVDSDPTEDSVPPRGLLGSSDACLPVGGLFPLLDDLPRTHAEDFPPPHPLPTPVPRANIASKLGEPALPHVHHLQGQGGPRRGQPQGEAA